MEHIIVVLSILLCVVSVLCIVILIKYILIKINIKNMIKTIEYINENNTNILVTIASQDKDLHNLGKKINENIKYLNQLRYKITSDEEKLVSTITNLCHDLRTPITSVIGYTQMLMKEDLSSEEKKYLQVIEIRIKDLKDIVDQIYEYSLAYEEKDFELSNVDIKSLLEEIMLSYYDNFVNKNFKVEINLPDSPIIKSVDKFQIKRVFTNIIGNALKYGSNSFTVEYKDNTFRFINYTLEIDCIDIEHIFDRFFTVAKSRTNGSTGLGLAISRKIIEKMNGSLTAELNDSYLTIILKI